MDDLQYTFIKPDKELADFVESFGVFYMGLGQPKEVIIIPDGKIDLFFTQSGKEAFQVLLTGLETLPKQRSIAPGTLFFDINFKPLGVEYILRTPIANIVNSAKYLPDDFWNFDAATLKDFNAFHKKATQKIKELLPIEIDERKRRLFELIYASNGEVSIKELSVKLNWSGRQMNRYFNSRFGMSLKAYCNILRFRVSLEHIAQGEISPKLNFTDQNHFIKEIKKFSGVVPKELFKNKNDRFILLSVLKQQ